MSFEERSKAAKEFQDKLFADLQAMGFNVALNGTEHTHPAFASELHRSEDQTSMAIRYAPDGVACIGKIPRSFYVEAKFARTIERNAWIQYGKLVEAGNILVIVFGWENNTVFNFYENIKLIPGEISGLRYPASSRYPVEDGWIYPRKSKLWDNSKSPKASGTPYKEVDLTSLIPFSEFYKEIVNRLRVEQCPSMTSNISFSA